MAGLTANLVPHCVIFLNVFGMPDQKAKAILNDIGTEELAHLEMVGTIVHQLTKDASIEEIEKAGLGTHYTDHGVDVYPQSAAGVPFNATCLACKGDPIANLQENLAADKKGYWCNLFSHKSLKMPNNSIIATLLVIFNFGCT